LCRRAVATELSCPPTTIETLRETQNKILLKTGAATAAAAAHRWCRAASQAKEREAREQSDALETSRGQQHV